MPITNPDVIVIGAGATGGVTAKILAEAGLTVVLFERGENHYVGLDDPDGIITNHFGNDTLKFVHRDFIWQDPRIEPRTFQSEPGGELLVGRVQALPATVGGGSVDYAGTSVRCRPKDFRVRTHYGQIPGTSIEDWPISYDDLEPYYSEVEWMIGVQGDAGQNPFEGHRSRPFPMPPHYPKLTDLIVVEAAQRLGYHPYAQPMAINSVAYRGRPACANCGFCDSHGCAINAKGNTAVTVIRDALLTGNCELRTGCFVHRLETNAGGDRVERVHYIDESGDAQSETAGIVVLAANAIESARLCLLSAGGAHPDGIGNSSDQVGRHLTFHHTDTVIGVMPFRTHPQRGRQGSHGMDDFNQSPDEDPEMPFGLGIVLTGAQPHPLDEAKQVRIFGQHHKEYMRTSLYRDRVVTMELIAEDAPVPTNRVELDPDVRDVYGFAVPRITYKPHAATEEAALAYIEPRLIAIMEEAGAIFTHYEYSGAQRGVPDSFHLMGTLRMGTDPAASVTDEWGRFHDVENLYCADGGVYVTSTGYNPTQTMQALAARQAHRILS